MIERSPCESYLKFLLCHPDGYSPTDIRSMVRMQGLDFIGMPYLERLKRGMLVPQPFYPEEEQHHLSTRFLRKEKLTILFRPDDHMHAATKILGQPKAKELMESMIICRADPAWTCAALKQQNYYATPEAVTRYTQHYFNIDLIDTTALRTLLELRGFTSGDIKDIDELAIGNLYIKTSRNDQRRISASMNSPKDAMLLTLIRMGNLPSSVDVGRLVAATRIVSLIQCRENTDHDQPGKAKDYALIAEMMTKIMEQTGDPSKSVSEGIAELKLVTDTVPTPHIKELQGEHTLDVQPLEEREMSNEHPE